MSQRGMNLVYMAADSHSSFLLVRFLTGKKKKKEKTSQDDSATDYFLIE